jgi:hypothetical protein
MEGIPVGPPHEEDCPRDMARRDAFIHMDVVEEEERTAELRVGGGRALAWHGGVFTRGGQGHLLLLQSCSNTSFLESFLAATFCTLSFFFSLCPGPRLALFCWPAGPAGVANDPNIASSS